jgi:hypothetical protein
MSSLAIGEKMECIICQESFSEKDMETRKCGHASCRRCDNEWRRRSSIVVTKNEICESGCIKEVKQYHVQSSCPMCRAKDTIDDFEYRSKESLAAELSIALGMIHQRKIYNLEVSRPTPVYIPLWQRRREQRERRAAVARPVIHEMDNLSRQIIQQMIAEGQIEPGLMPPVPAPPVQVPVPAPPVQVPVPAPPVAAPVQVPAQEPPAQVQAQVVRIVPLHPRLVLIDDEPEPAPAPIAVQAVVIEDEPHHNYGLLHHAGRPRQPRNDICINHQLNRGCYTDKTKMKCSTCSSVLCRTCQRNCPVCNR